MRVLDMAFFRKVVLRHDTGLGEAYMDGDFEVHSALNQQLAVCTSSLQSVLQGVGCACWEQKLALRR